MSLDLLRANRLREHESAIERSLSELGWHLRAIRDEQLFLDTHKTFEDYCRERWHYTARYVNMQIAAAETIDVIEASGTMVPQSERQVRPLSALPIRERVEAWAEAIAEVDGQPTGEQVADAVVVVENRRRPKLVPTGGKRHDGPPHPATFPAAVLDVFRVLLAGHWTVLDPFAGVGGIHALRPAHDTYGIEIERDWAVVSPHTVTGDARRVAELYPGRVFDAIATSPAYGNRLADAFYHAYDPEARRTYAFDLGRSLNPANGAGMHFDTDGAYEQLHLEVWRAVVAVLRPAGLFLLNCKDFQRDGQIVPVTGWHVGVLSELGLHAVDVRCLPAAGLPYTTAKPMSELVIAFRKESER